MKRQKKIFVTKSSGSSAPYERNKLKSSLEKSRADKKVIDSILKHIDSIIYDGITTKEIYKLAYKLLYKKERFTAEIYKLKSAIAELGPTGYPFEKFIGELLAFKGYDVNVSQMISGACVDHEVDVFAEKDGKILLAECKFHTDPNRHSDVKVPLYIYSRFEDIFEAWEKDSNFNREFTEGRIYTNTRFTMDAKQFAKCKGISLVAWDYPEKGSLKDQIDYSNLYPITCLSRLTKAEKQKLLNMDIVLVRDICGQSDVLRKIGVEGEARISNILRDAEKICKK
jgi:hypothetical protein